MARCYFIKKATQLTFIKNQSVNVIFLAHLVVVFLIVIGILPRVIVPFWTMVLAIYVIWASLEDSATFFIRSIPFFVAIPITATFDSLNMWRVLSGLIFLKWLWFFKPKVLPKLSPKSLILAILLLAAILSVTQAQNYTLAIKRIIYFINLSLIGIVIHDLVKKNQYFSRKLVKNIAVPTIIVAIVGMIQLASTYYMDIFQFIDFWGDTVERGLFGNVWADIAIKANTWFAYFGDQLSLRMFSIFADSHSFPIFLVLGLPAILAVSLDKIIAKKENFKSMLHTRARMLILFVPLVFLDIILTGTRGMWAAGAGSLLLVIGYWLYFTKHRPDIYHKSVFKYISAYLSVFFLLFAVAYPIFASPQFQLAKDTGGLLTKRVRSIIDLAETSNSRRLEIWRDSIHSIIKHPFLGVGIGNFPVVVGENLAKAKAGSSAHNLYLHIAAEIGIPGLLAVLYFFWLMVTKCYKNFVTETDPMLLTYFAASLIFIPWNLLYSLTDVAIFDERAFLLFVVALSIIFAGKND